MTARILIIDDEPKWITFAEDDLGTAFLVEVATDLKMALTKLKTHRYDLIITSSHRPDILEAIHKYYPGKRVVVATGQATTREAISMYRLGALDYFVKDFRRDVVAEKILDAINKPAKSPAQ